MLKSLVKERSDGGLTPTLLTEIYGADVTYQDAVAVSPLHATVKKVAVCIAEKAKQLGAKGVVDIAGAFDDDLNKIGRNSYLQPTMKKRLKGTKAVIQSHVTLGSGRALVLFNAQFEALVEYDPGFLREFEVDPRNPIDSVKSHGLFLSRLYHWSAGGRQGLFEVVSDDYRLYSQETTLEGRRQAARGLIVKLAYRLKHELMEEHEYKARTDQILSYLMMVSRYRGGNKKFWTATLSGARNCFFKRGMFESLIKPGWGITTYAARLDICSWGLVGLLGMLKGSDRLMLLQSRGLYPEQEAHVHNNITLFDENAVCPGPGSDVVEGAGPCDYVFQTQDLPIAFDNNGVARCRNCHRRRCYHLLPQALRDQMNTLRRMPNGALPQALRDKAAVYVMMWNEMYNLLCAYKDKYGNCDVPFPYKENPTLANWVSKQRTENNKNRLDPIRKQRLDNIGFTWDALEARWNEMYNHLCAYKDKYGDCDVPHGYKENPTLANWVSWQRTHNNKDGLDPIRKQRLDNIGFTWDALEALEARWNEMYNLLCAYKDEYGDCDVPKQYKENPALANWVHKQRHDNRHGDMRPDRKERLVKLGFNWDVRGLYK